jgi:hypothetical protein
MKKYEYFTDYFAIPLKSKGEVDILALLKNPKYQEMMALMGKEGWELVNSLPITESMSSYSFWANDKYSSSVTTGFLLFWKRELS